MYSNKEKFYQKKGWERFKYLDTYNRIVVVLTILAAILALVFSFSEIIKIFSSIFNFIIPIIVAQQQNNPNSLSTNTNTKETIKMVIMIIIGITFLWSLLICFHSNNENRVKMASDINKMLLGFFIGVGKNYLGV